MSRQQPPHPSLEFEFEAELIEQTFPSRFDEFEGELIEHSFSSSSKEFEGELIDQAWAVRNEIPQTEQIQSTGPCQTRQEVVDQYKHNIQIYWMRVPKTIQLKDDSNSTITLFCYYMDPSKPRPYHWCQRDDIYQYSWIDPQDDRRIRQRPVAWRMPFLVTDEKKFMDSKMTVSHLCHDRKCYNWNHHVLEDITVNQSRNGCLGPGHCGHNPQCIIPGPRAIATRSIQYQ